MEPLERVAHLEPDPQMAHESVERLFRHQSAQLVTTLARIFGLDHLDAVEDAVQDAMMSALRIWPDKGVPDNPSAWLFQVGRNRLRDRLRQWRLWDEKRGEVEQFCERLSQADPMAPRLAAELEDDSLRMMFACCHPDIPRDGQVALTLKLVCGFSSREIARAFLSSEPTISQRIARAKLRLRQANMRLEIPALPALTPRLEPVLEVLYLLFNEGYSALEGDELVRTDLCHEAMRLCQLLTEHAMTNRPEVHALAALFLFQAARLPARVDVAGELLLLQEQDRLSWDQELMTRGVVHLRRAASGSRVTDVHIEAEIAAHHTLTEDFASTDWRRILDCYDALMERRPSPVVALNRTVALSRVKGAAAALSELERLAENRFLQHYAPYFATRGEVLRELDQFDRAAIDYQRALELTACEPVRRFLARRLEDVGQ